MLCASLDNKDQTLLDNEKTQHIQKLMRTGNYVFQSKEDGLRIGPGKTAEGRVFMVNRREDNKRGLPNIDYALEGNVPEAIAVAEKFPADTFLDGEGIVYSNPNVCEHKADCIRLFGRCHEGEPCRSLTQKRFGVRNAQEVQRRIHQLPVVIVAWDIRRLEGKDLTQLPLIERLQILKAFVENVNDPRLVFLPYYEDGVELFQKAHEGIVAKQKGSRYVPMIEGSSSSRPEWWIKIKHAFLRICEAQGYCSDGSGRISGLLRNIVLTYEGKYCGTVGGGLDDSDRIQLKAFFDKYPKQPAPFNISSKVRGHDLVYVPNTGLRIETAYQEIMPTGCLYALRCKRIIYPEQVQLPKENTEATEWFQKRYPLMFKT
jgi:ATP-dependent DNA ligase